jgi:membrane-associated phospholipid phosphatase
MGHDARHHLPDNPAEPLSQVIALNRSSLLVLLALALGIAVLATALQGPALWDVRAVRAFQGGGTLRLPMEAVTTLGADVFFLAFVLLIFWCIDRSLGIDLMVLLTICATANITLKALLQGPRPFWSDLSLRLTSGPSFSTPSGHASNSTVLFGYLAWWLAGRPRGRPLAARPQGSLLLAVPLLLVIGLVCLSRVYLGVHFPGDVIWGCAEGIVVLVAYIGLKPRVAAWLCARPLGTHIALAVGAAAAVLALTLLSLGARAACAPGFGEICVVARAQALGETANVAGLLLGAWIGLALERRFVRFATDGTTAQRVVRYLLGLAGLLVIVFGLGLLLEGAPAAAPDVALRVFRYAVAALWAVFAWPWLFVRTRLGKAEQPAGARGETI